MTQITTLLQIESISKEELFNFFEKLEEKRERTFRESQKSEKLTLQETAEYLNCSENTIHNYIKKGILPASKIGRRILIDRSEIENALSESKSLKYKRELKK